MPWHRTSGSRCSSRSSSPTLSVTSLKIGIFKNNLINSNSGQPQVQTREKRGIKVRRTDPGSQTRLEFSKELVAYITWPWTATTPTTNGTIYVLTLSVAYRATRHTLLPCRNGSHCFYLRNVHGFPPLRVGTPRCLKNEVPVKEHVGTAHNGTIHPQTNLWPRSHPFFICMSMEHTCQRTYADVFLNMKTKHMITCTGILHTTGWRCLKP